MTSRTDNKRVYVPEHGAPMEHAIVRALLKTLDEAGFVPVAVWDGEEYVAVWSGDDYEPRGSDGNLKLWRALTDREALDVVFATSDCTLHFAPTGKLEPWGNHGVYLVVGNGEDIISNTHMHRGAWDNALEALSEKLYTRKYALTLHTDDDEIEVAA